MKKLMLNVLLLVSILLLILSSSVFAKSNFSKMALPILKSACSNVEGDVSYVTQEDGAIKKVIKVKNPTKFAKDHGFDLHSPDEKIILVLPISPNSIDLGPIQQNIIAEPNSGNDYYIKNVLNAGEACGTQLIRSSYFQSPGGTMSINEQVSASYSVSVNISSSIISAAVQFSVTSTFGVTDTQNIIVPANKTGNIKAYPIYDTYSFEVWEDDIFYDDFVEYGSAYKPIGVCFVVSIF